MSNDEIAMSKRDKGFSGFIKIFRFVVVPHRPVQINRDGDGIRDFQPVNYENKSPD